MTIIISLLLCCFTAMVNAGASAADDTNSTGCLAVNPKFAQQSPKKCNCTDVEKYNCCTSPDNVIYCARDLTNTEITVYQLYLGGSMALNIVGFFYCLYSFYLDYNDQKSKSRSKNFKYSLKIRGQIILFTTIYFLLISLQFVDPHDGVPNLFGEVYSQVIVTLTLRVPQWQAISVIFLFIEMWRGLVEQSKTLKKVNKLEREKKEKAVHMKIIIFVVFMNTFALVVAILGGSNIIDPLVAEWSTNIVMALVLLFLGCIGSPYYGYQVGKIIKSAKSRKVKELLGNIHFVAWSMAALCWFGMGVFIFTIIMGTAFWVRLIDWIGIQTSMSVAMYIVLYAINPSRSTAVGRRRSMDSSSKVSTVTSEMVQQSP